MQDPVAATATEVAGEVDAVAAVAGAACPLRVALERVVVTSGGAVMAAWQVLVGVRIKLPSPMLVAAPFGAFCLQAWHSLYKSHAGVRLRSSEHKQTYLSMFQLL